MLLSICAVTCNTTGKQDNDISSPILSEESEDKSNPSDNNSSPNEGSNNDGIFDFPMDEFWFNKVRFKIIKLN